MNQPRWICFSLITLAMLFSGCAMDDQGMSPAEARALFAEAKRLTPWIEARKEAFFGIEPVKDWEALCEAPLTRRRKTIYVHLTGEKLQGVTDLVLRTTQTPSGVELLGDSAADVSFAKADGGIRLNIGSAGRNPLGEIVVVEF